MNNDKELTVLLLLKDRPLFTLRWMSYANKIHLPFKVFIADGGKDETVPKILSNKSHFPNVDYEYVRYPYDRTYSEYYRKVANALSRIDTPFVVQVPNDDFYFVEGLKRSVDFLRVHPDYAASGGDMKDFTVESCKRHGMSPFYGSITFPGKAYPARDIIDDTAMGRLRTYICGRVSTFLWVAVHRTDSLKRSFQTLSNINPKDLRFSEHLIYLLTIAAGKTHRESGLYLLHQDNTQEALGAKIAREIPTYLHWIKRKGWSEDFSNFVQAVSKAVADYDGVPVGDACEDFKHLYLSFIGKGVVRMFCPQTEPSKPTNEHDIESSIEQSSEFNMTREFLANGPSTMEIAIWKKAQRPFSALISLLKRLKKRFL
ncbi:TIGR00180 family glycosyltransferase [Candidatus Omnitrophota bacterium]